MKTDLLEFVQAELAQRSGQLRQIADASGLDYSAVLRIRDSIVDPGYSKVATLARYLKTHPRRNKLQKGAAIDDKKEQT